MSNPTYLQQFTAYAPELGQAIRQMPPEFLRELKTSETSLAAFNVCEAFSVFWALWHGGQHDRLYALGSCFDSTFEFRAAGNLSLDTLDEDAHELYGHLVAAFGFTEEVVK